MMNLVPYHTLYHYRCCWCQRSVHETCFAKRKDQQIIKTNCNNKRSENKKKNDVEKEEECDFGKWKRYILPPRCVIHRRIWSTKARGRAIALEEIKDFRSFPNIDSDIVHNWEPLFVFANRKSGNNDAGIILSRFLSVLNPLQVVDLSQESSSSSSSMELSLQICKMLPTGVQSRILVAGGDGTIGWVLNTIAKFGFNGDDRNDDQSQRQHQSSIPAVAILPLGTGNDLARVFGWWNQDNLITPTTHRLLNRQDLIQAIYRAERVQLDRWMVDIRPYGPSDYYHQSRSLLIASLRIPKSIMPTGNHIVMMYNYFSVGVDALVALNFHETRKSSLYKFFFT